MERLREDWAHGCFGLYVHWPFCQSKCPYCDFNSHVATKVNQGRWLAAYLAEIDRIGALTSHRKLDSVFFGGGTPSLMDEAIVAGILDRVRVTWSVSNDWEVTLEANPGSVEAGRFRAYRHAGVNRLSLGVQALNDGALRALGRLHSVEEALRALRVAQTCFDRVSIDLIYARQDQTPAEWRKELLEAIELGTDHLSLYQLTVEDGTAFGDRHARGKLKGLPDETRAVDLYGVTQEVCAAAGFRAYEVSNHARIGSEGRHNLLYWRGGDYCGIGPGAHGRLTFGEQRQATEALRLPALWLQAVERGQPAETFSELSQAERVDEYLVMGLRLDEGIDPGRLERMLGRSVHSQVLADLVDLGMIETTTGRIRATAKGRLVLNAVIESLSANL